MKERILLPFLILFGTCLNAQDFSQFIFPETVPDSIESVTCWRFKSNTDSSIMYTSKYKKGKLISYSYDKFSFSCSYDTSGKLIAERTINATLIVYEGIDSFYYNKKGQIISGKMTTNNSSEAQYCRFLYNINGKLDSMVCTTQLIGSVIITAKARYADTVVITQVYNPDMPQQYKHVKKYLSKTKKMLSMEFVSSNKHEIQIYERNDSLRIFTTKIFNKLTKQYEKTYVFTKVTDLVTNEVKYFNYEGELLYTDKLIYKYY